MSKKLKYFHPKRPLIMFDGVFYALSHNRQLNTTKVSQFLRNFGNFEPKIGKILRKNWSRNLKLRNLKKQAILFNSCFCRFGPFW